MKKMKYILLAGILGIFFVSPVVLAYEDYEDCITQEMTACTEGDNPADPSDDVDPRECVLTCYESCDAEYPAEDYSTCTSRVSSACTASAEYIADSTFCSDYEAGRCSAAAYAISSYEECIAYYYLECTDDGVSSETCETRTIELCSEMYPEEDLDWDGASFYDWDGCYDYYYAEEGMDSEEAIALCCEDYEYELCEEMGLGGGEGDSGSGGSSTLLRTSGTIPNPLGAETTISSVFINIVQAILGIVGSLAFLVFIYNGFRFIFAAGNEETVSKAKKGMVWSMLGVGLILTAYTIIQYVFTSVGF